MTNPFSVFLPLLCSRHGSQHDDDTQPQRNQSNGRPGSRYDHLTDPNQLFHFTQGVGTDWGLPNYGYVKTDPVLTSILYKDTITLRIISLLMLSVRCRVTYLSCLNDLLYRELF